MAKTISPAKLKANRLNAKKSTGPKTEEGKKRSAQNASKSTGPKTAKGKARSVFNATKDGYWSQPSDLRYCIDCSKDCTFSWPPQKCIAEKLAEKKE